MNEFYCFNCQTAFEKLREHLRCPKCSKKVFDSYDELQEYLEDKTVLNNEPFTKPRKFKEFRE